MLTAAPEGSTAQIKLGSWMRDRREEVGLSAQEVASAAWDHMAIPLRVDTLCKMERGGRLPQPYHLDAIMVILGLGERERKWAIRQWAQATEMQEDGRRWRDLVASDRPLAKTRRSPAGHIGASRIRSSREVGLSPVLKLHMTEADRALLEATARTLDATASDVVRSVLLDAIAQKRVPTGMESSGARGVAKNVRVELTAHQLAEWRKISAGHKLATWAYLVVFERLRGTEPLPELIPA